jgi:hypothetical protein
MTHRVVPWVGTDVSEEYELRSSGLLGIGIKWIQKWLGRIACFILTVGIKSDWMLLVKTPMAKRSYQVW